MKKNIAIAALAAALLLTGCGNGNSSTVDSDSSASDVSSESNTLTTAAEKADALLAGVTFSGEMVSIDGESMEFRLGFTSEGLTDFAAYVCGSGAYPDEFGVFTAESSEKAAEIKTALDKRIETQKATYSDYTPDEMYKFDDCFVKQDGNTVYYAVTADNAKAEEILK